MTNDFEQESVLIFNWRVTTYIQPVFEDRHLKDKIPNHMTLQKS